MGIRKKGKEKIFRHKEKKISGKKNFFFTGFFFFFFFIFLREKQLNLRFFLGKTIYWIVIKASVIKTNIIKFQVQKKLLKEKCQFF